VALSLLLAHIRRSKRDRKGAAIGS
jgi:hypothetical protein